MSTAFPSPLILLTTFITPLVVIAGWETIKTRVRRSILRHFLITRRSDGRCFLRLTDAMLFYVFWEAMLVPMFLIIGIWGGERRSLCNAQVLPLHLPRFGVDAGLALIYMYLTRPGVSISSMVSRLKLVTVDAGADS